MSSPHGAADYQPPAGSNSESESKPFSQSSLREQLDKVLEQTLSQSVHLNTDSAALRAVAKRHGHLSFGLKPVVAALVEAMLSDSFRMHVPSQNSWESMVHEIATVLHEDPIACRRLQQLWQQLVMSQNEH